MSLEVDTGLPRQHNFKLRRNNHPSDEPYDELIMNQAGGDFISLNDCLLEMNDRGLFQKKSFDELVVNLGKVQKDLLGLFDNGRVFKGGGERLYNITEERNVMPVDWMPFYNRSLKGFMYDDSAHFSSGIVRLDKLDDSGNSINSGDYSGLRELVNNSLPVFIVKPGAINFISRQNGSNDRRLKLGNLNVADSNSFIGALGRYIGAHYKFSVNYDSSSEYMVIPPVTIVKAILYGFAYDNDCTK